MLNYNDLLEIIKYKLGIKTDLRDTLLKALIESSVDELKNRYGVKLDLEKSYHQMFVSDYVVWKYERNPIMPKRLQYELHNLKMQFGDKPTLKSATD